MSGLPKILKAESYASMKNGEYLFQMALGRKLFADKHSHDFYEIIIVIKGGCKQMINDEIYDCGMGSITVLCPGDEHCFLSQEADTIVAALSVTEVETEKFAEAFELKDVLKNKFTVITSEADTKASDDKRCVSIKISEMEILRTEKLCNELSVIPEDKRGNMCKILLSEVFSYIIRNRHKDTKAPPSEFIAVLSEVNKLENAAKGVNAFLNISNFSHSQLCRLTKRYLGMTPSEYINDIRMKYALEMILNSDANYETVCETVGFKSLSHFYGLFVKKFGVTPSVARKGRYNVSRSV